ncbi:MAG: MFS transporter, partial [Planctomycetota bacterium JB042]
LVVSSILLPRATGRAKAVSLRALWSDDARIRWLSAARLFLFGARDVWFVLAVPVFLAADLGWSFTRVGGFLALWVIGYGLVQAAAPAWVSGRSGAPPTAGRLVGWTWALVLPMGAILCLLRAGAPPGPTLVAGLAVFGLVFAANSAVHSFLIVRYSDADRVSLNVGFYYMAHAAGRLVGTVLSGAVFQAAGEGRAGLEACLATSIGMVVLSAVLGAGVRRAERLELA